MLSEYKVGDLMTDGYSPKTIDHIHDVMSARWQTALLVTCALLLAILPAHAQPSIDPHAVIKRLAATLRQRYVFPERAESAMRHLEAAETRGEFDHATSCPDLTVSLNAFLTGELHDQHLRVDCIPTDAAVDSSRTAKPIADRYRDFDRMTAERENHGVRTVAQLSGNVGYLRISGFPDAAIMAAPLTHAFALLQHTDSLIVDVRDNHGGDPQAVALLESYFFEPWKPRVLNEVIARQESGFDTHQYWTTPVPASLYYDREVYVLTSSRTISAGEGFSYEMQAEKRATVVGEVTAGAANPAADISLGDGFRASIPFGRALNPVTKSNWEGVGVAPEVTVSAAEALSRAYVMALRRSAEKQPHRAAELSRLIEMALANPSLILAQ